MKINHKGDYAERRRAAYDPIGDQMDAILKGMAKRRDTLSPEELGVVERWEAVKRDIPKPV